VLSLYGRIKSGEGKYQFQLGAEIQQLNIVIS